MVHLIYFSVNTQDGTILKSTTESPKEFSYVRSTSNLSSLTTNSVTPRDEELFTFLNTPNSSPKKNIVEVSMSSPTASLVVNHTTDITDSVSDLSIHSGRTSPSSVHTSVDVPDNLNNDSANVNNANFCKNEIVNTLNDEIMENQTSGIVLNNGKFRC